MRYEVSVQWPDRDAERRYVFAVTRRYNGAINERDAMVERHRRVWAKHGLRVVSGPLTPEGDDIAVVGMDGGVVVTLVFVRVSRARGPKGQGVDSGGILVSAPSSRAAGTEVV